MPETESGSLRSSTARTRAARVSEAIERYRNDSRWQQWVLVAIALLSALAIRLFLIPDTNNDITTFYEPWFERIRQERFASLGQEFANYNVPYLYLLFVGSLTPLDAIVVIKGISIVFDIVLCAGIVAIVYHFRRNALLAAASGASAILLPEVFLNSGMWGQAESFYVSMLVWTAYFLVSRRDIWAWIFFALAFSFKLQAAFLLPWILLAFLVQRHRWRAPLIAVAIFFATWIPALVAGRSVRSLASIYINQTSDGARLTSLAANMYQWVPNEFYDTVRPAGIAFALGVGALLIFLYLRRVRSLERPELFLLQAAAAISALVPFVLPQMHDRYFYAAGVFAFICALLMKEYIIPAIMLQFTAVITYSWVLFQTPSLIPMELLAVVQLVAVGWIVALSLVRSRTTVSPVYLPPVLA